jgi:outer membrane protein TolC
MTNRYRRRAGLLAGALIVVGVSMGLRPGAAQPNPTRVAAAAPTIPPNPPGQPTPYPLNTLGPVQQVPALPYPEYGTPAPNVVGTTAPGVPPTVSLQQAIMIGFAKSPTLATERGSVAVAQAGVRLERAGLLPSFSASVVPSFAHVQPGGSVSSSSSPTSGTGSTGTTGTTGSSLGIFPLAASAPTAAPVAPVTKTNFFTNTLSLQLSQLIYDGGRLADSVRATVSGERATVDTYERDLQTVAYNVATAYYNYLAAERTVQVDLEIVREDSVQLDLVRAQVRAGTAPQVDIETTELPLAQARLAVVKAQGAAYGAEAAFANAMGLDANLDVQPIDDAPIFTKAPLSTIPIPPYDTAIKRAVALRPDYDSAAQQVVQAQYNLKAARLGTFPTLSASGGYNDGSTDGNGGAFRNSETVAVTLSIPIYDQGMTAANTLQAQGNLTIANANLQNTLLGLQLSIKQALTNLVSSLAAIDQTQVEYTTAVANLEATQAQYRAGVTTLPLLLDAQVGITQALTDRVSAVYTLRLAEQQYLYAVGSNYQSPI